MLQLEHSQALVLQHAAAARQAFDSGGRLQLGRRVDAAEQNARRCVPRLFARQKHRHRAAHIRRPICDKLARREREDDKRWRGLAGVAQAADLGAEGMEKIVLVEAEGEARGLGWGQGSGRGRGCGKGGGWG